VSTTVKKQKNNKKILDYNKPVHEEMKIEIKNLRDLRGLRGKIKNLYNPDEFAY